MRAYQDHDECMQKVALGDPHEGYTDAELDRLRDNYRNGLPRNPFLEHMFYTADLEKARAEGSTTARTLCGEVVEIDESRFDYGAVHEVEDYRAPGEVRDQEYEDPKTGLWWVEQECVDCLRISNQMASKAKRDELLGALSNLLATYRTMTRLRWNGCCRRYRRWHGERQIDAHTGHSRRVVPPHGGEL
ncbi:Hypothetical protein ERS075643_00007 [Mycobacteroides abscessus]|nr:Hypothetical protein ERS075643_00007 [Mycobacteroides abscessus]